ncbi:MAG TPA: FtsX-like permease family protein [Verrucomicrobiae bacterium]|jgi:ABC-type lipoprotein release transport system permease subunit|nr:FtsX-like permease family protein [Verrucomicrobiae bacterium]
MFLLKLAFLNIGRNPRRSMITVLAVGVGLAALIFLWAFSDGTNEQMRENVIRLFTGHVQVHAKDFGKRLSPELTIPDRAAVLEKIRSLPGVVAVTERVKCEALVGTSENSRGILLMGIDPEKEAAATDLENYVKKGEFLLPSTDRDILVGDLLAEKINLAVGDKVVVMTQAMDGTLAGYSYRVRGLFHTGSQQVDELTAYITLKSAQDLLGTGAETHEIVIRLDNRHLIPSFIARLGLGTGYEVLSWDQIVPEVEQWASWAEAIIRTILVAVMIVIGVSIMNTVLMSVYERTREFGVMMAVGTAPSQVVRLILLETLVLEALGILVGFAVGYLIVLYFGTVGIGFPELERAFSRSYMSTITYTRLEPTHVLQSISTLVLMTTGISFYPAWKAGQMEPVKAIYHSYA